MERIFRDSKASEIIPCDYSAPVFLFPVRHHSPVCSFHLKKAIAQYNPDIILIEGPCTANELIPAIVSENTVLPAAFYYYYKDTKGLVSDEKLDYKCYYPFMYSSPEYNAMAEAKRRNIPAEFIDLPYCDILINTHDNKGFRKKAEKHSYADDTLLTKSKFFSRLCEKTGLRNFDEFWEKYFEINGLFISTEQFIRQMHTYCILTRAETPEEEIEADGSKVRESFMTQQIKKFSDTYSKIMVVTGGFHSYGIYTLLEQSKIKSVKPHSIPKTQQGCYPMAYSYEACNALSGYASGMNYPGFYDTVMKKLNESENPAEIYNNVTLDLLLKTSKESVKKDILISMSDITNAHTMMTGLSALRNCKESGIFETIDAVTSCFIKGEKTLSSSVPLDILSKLAEGSETGHIGDNSHIPPLITDFEARCKSLSLKSSSVIVNNAECQLFTSEKGLKTSRFFHQMRFLGTNFCEMLKGPDLHRNKDRSRVREEWRYRRTPSVDSALIDHTTDGFTIEEASKTYASKLIKKSKRCAEAAQVAVDCFLMGVELEISKFLDSLIISDGDIFSVSAGMKNFKTLYDLQKLYNFNDAAAYVYIEKCFSKLTAAVSNISDIPAEQADAYVEMLKLMNDIAVNVLSDKNEIFFSALKTAAETSDKEPSVYGAVMGLLCAEFPEYREEAEKVMQGYLTGSAEIKKQGAGYLKGLFSVARDIVFSDDKFLSMTDKLICSMDYDDFIEVLPSLRLAFNNFTPSEIKTFASFAAKLHKTEEDNILNKAAIDEHLSDYGKKLDYEIYKLMFM